MRGSSCGDFVSGRKPFLKKEWSWMLGAQVKGLQLQTLAPDAWMRTRWPHI